MWIRLKMFCVVLPMAVLGCGHDRSVSPPDSSGAPAVTAQPDEPAGAELWAENCSRCHNIRSPRSYSSAQWETIVHHMRLRANLTGDEARLITQFLQASN
jgi:cytochrome c5